MKVLAVLAMIDKTDNGGLSTKDKLDLTDVYIVTHLEQLSLKKNTTLTDDEYVELCAARDIWRTNDTETFIDSLEAKGFKKVVENLKDKNKDYYDVLKKTKI